MTRRQKAVVKCVGRYSPAIMLALWAILVYFGVEGHVFKIVMLLATAAAAAVAETIRITDKNRRRRRERQRARKTHTS